MSELLTDAVYREFLLTKPTMPRPLFPEELPWRVYVQRELGGRWSRRDFHTYVEGFRFMKKLLPSVNDAALQSKGIAWDAPAKVVRVMTKDARGKRVPKLDEKKKQVYRRIVWQPTLPEAEEPHTWCTYCRRPTIFKWFSKHHAFPGMLLESPYQRCCICGSSERLVFNHA